MKYWDGFLEGVLSAACIGLSVTFILIVIGVALAIASVPVALAFWLWTAVL